jgi:peptide/nickel transport system permease protein
MLAYILRRIAISIPILLGVTVITFTFTQLVPGDYIDTLLNPEKTSANRADMEALEKQLGLDQSAPVLYFRWMGELIQGNLGESLATRKPVSEEITRRLIPTLKLSLSALLFAVIVGVILGIISALKPYSAIDYILTFSGFLWISVPAFFAAIIGIYIFGLKLEWFPVSGMGPAGQTDVGILTQIHYLALPAAILGLERIATFMRYARATMLEVLRQDYVTVARAKGLSGYPVVMRHAFRNALLPLITVIGLSLPSLIGGSIIMESIFGWPGLGTYGLAAVAHRDYPVIMGVNFVAAVVVLASNLLSDVAYGIADPRIRYS